MKKDDNFQQLLWRGGFVTVFGGRTCIDRSRACEFLSCSVRTLERWLSGATPCPRAVKLLQTLEYTLPDDWRGARFDRRGLLFLDDAKRGFSFDDVRGFAATFGRMQAAESDTQYLRAHIDTLRDSRATGQARHELLAIGNQLAALLANPIFLTDGIKKSGAAG